MNFRTPEQYNTAKSQLSAYETVAEQYIKDNKTNGIPAEICATFPFADVVDNELRSAIEVYEFVNNPPDKYFLYVSEVRQVVTTWTGQILGDITYMGNPYRDSFGGKRQSIRFKGINGLQYYGTYYKSAGDYARVKMYK
jgi:hypothetical protein